MQELFDVDMADMYTFFSVDGLWNEVVPGGPTGDMIGELMYFVEPETGMTWDDFSLVRGRWFKAKETIHFFLRRGWGLWEIEGFDLQMF